MSNIPRLKAHEAHRTLGVCIAPDGNWDNKLLYLVSLAKKWQQKMQSSKLTRSDALFSLRNVIYWKLVYPLLTTSFMVEQCNQVTSPLLVQGLPAAGFVCTFLRALAHGPLCYGGAKSPNLYTEQLISHIQVLLRYLSSPEDTTGFLLRVTGKAM